MWCYELQVNGGVARPLQQHNGLSEKGCKTTVFHFISIPERILMLFLLNSCVLMFSSLGYPTSCSNSLMLLPLILHHRHGILPEDPAKLSCLLHCPFWASTKYHVYRSKYLCCTPAAWTGKEDNWNSLPWSWHNSGVNEISTTPSISNSAEKQSSLQKSNSYVYEYVGDPDLRCVGVFWTSITFWPSSSQISFFILGLVFKCLRRVSAKLLAVPHIWTHFEAELPGPSSFEESNSPVKVSSLVLNGTYFWTNAQQNKTKTWFSPEKSHQPILKARYPRAALKACCLPKEYPQEKLVVELASLCPLSWPEFLHLLCARPL